MTADPDAPAAGPRRQVLLALASFALAACGAPVIAPHAPAPQPPAPPQAPRPPQTTAIAPVADPVPPAPVAAPPPPDRWVLALPPRDPAMETGSAFLERIKRLPRRELDEAVIEAVMSGNVPPYQRRLAPLELRGRDAGGTEHVVTVHVLCDYLAIGSDDDFINIPMTAQAAQRIAGKLSCVLPTPKLVDDIWRGAAVQLKPLFIEGGPDPDLNRHDDYIVHKRMLDDQRRESGVVLGALVAGTKKDIVVTNRLVDHAGKVAIYGWHKPGGQPIQPLSTRHSRIYADYSHGVRLVADRVLVGGEERALVEMVCDDQLCPLLSNEGPLEVPIYPS